MQVKKQQLERDMVQNWERSMSRLYIVTLLINYMQSTSCEMPGWMKHKLESRLPGEVSITSDMQMIHPNGRKCRGAKEPLEEGEREE